ncbi:MAG TPA: zinc ABC transporter solute-binding protein [Firmicutes bacterium]|nr:zinc ABC transporter solute-binding protein [Bacillota bacterium]
MIPFVLCLLLAMVIGVGTKASSSGEIKQLEKIKVFVSILPQKYFVERIGGDQVTVAVMVGPGQNPATYEPLPQQMSALATTQLYFRIGVPFETAWIDRLSELNRDLVVIDTREGIPLRKMESSHYHREEESRADAFQAEPGEGLKDPHIWLDPVYVKRQAATICRALAALDPAHRGLYEANLFAFQKDLDELDQELSTAFRSLAVKKLMVFHPAWGYLTDRYGLEQIPLEVEGKEPGPRELAHAIDYAKAAGIRVIFIQSQFNAAAAEAVARAVGGRVVTIDPLAEDYLTNMRRIAQTIKRSYGADEDRN